MMITKRVLLAGVLALALGMLSLWPYNTKAAEGIPLVSVQHEGIRHSESIYPYAGGLFISNVGPQMRPQTGEKTVMSFIRKMANSG